MDPNTLPEIPADLSELSDDELGALSAQIAAYGRNALADPEITDERIATELAPLAGRLADIAGIQTARAEAAAAAAAAVEARGALADRFSAVEPVAADEPAPAPEAVTAAVVTPRATTPAVPKRTETLAAKPRATKVEDLPPLAAMLTPFSPGRENEVRNQAIQPTSTITAAGDVAFKSTGEAFTDLFEVEKALESKWQSSNRTPASADGEKVYVARAVTKMPEERILSGTFDAADYAKLGKAGAFGYQGAMESLTASGGVCVPAMPYYDIMTIAGAMRPVRDAFVDMMLPRGGLNVIPPPQFSDLGTSSRSTSADGVTTSGQATITSASANFSAGLDVGATISGSIAGIPAGTLILSVQSPTSATLSANATATTASNVFTITRPGSTGYITSATDAAALGQAAGSAAALAATKPCLHVSCPAPTTYTVAAISRCVELGNFQARSYPEQQAAWLQLAMAQWARRGETALLDALAAKSAQVTMPKTTGAARQLVAQVAHQASYYRNRNRMAPETPLRVLMPWWVHGLAIADLAHGSGYDPQFLTQAREIFEQGLGDLNVNISWYVDSGTGKGQLWNGGNAMTAGAAPPFPSTVVWYLYAEGSWIFGDQGNLDFGIVRDSTLNSLNNFRVFGESFEVGVYVGVECIETTSTVVADGSYSAALAAAITSF